MKFLISPGLPRSGTTYLFSQLGLANGDLFNVPHGKETNIFWKNRNLDELLADTFRTQNSEKYYIDFSPSYLEGRPHSIERIAKLAKLHDVKLLLHLRSPVEQAFAHYLHDVSAHVSRLEFDDSADYSFWAPKVLKRYLVKRAALIRMLVECVGRDNILVVNFHRDISDAVCLTHKVGKFLGLDLKPFCPTKIGVGGWVPRYLYSGNASGNFVHCNEVCTIPPRQVLLVNGEFLRLWTDVEESFALMLLRGQSSWTTELNEEQCETLWNNFFRTDFAETLSILGEHVDDFPRQMHLTSSVPRLDAATFAKLRPITPLSERLAQLGNLSPSTP